MVLPVPAHGRSAGRGRPPGGGARPGGVRPLGQAGRPRRLHLRPPRARGCARWLEANDLRHITLVCQDWGGLVGLRVVAEHPDRFDRVVVANTFLPTGDRPAGDGFLKWRTFSQEVPEFDSGKVVQSGCATTPGPRGGRRLRRPVPRPGLHRRRPPVPHPRPHHARRPRRGGQPCGLEGPGGVGPAHAVRLLRPGPRHRRQRAGLPPARARHDGASATPPSRAPGTSCRRTRAPSSPPW